MDNITLHNTYTDPAVQTEVGYVPPQKNNNNHHYFRRFIMRLLTVLIVLVVLIALYSYGMKKQASTQRAYDLSPGIGTLDTLERTSELAPTDEDERRALLDLYRTRSTNQTSVKNKTQ